MVRKMTGWCVLLASISIIVLDSFNGSGTTLSTREMQESRGADPGSAECQDRCDKIAGLYLGCAEDEADCRQCGSAMMGMFFPSFGSKLGTPGAVGCTVNGGRMTGGGNQDCGNILEGACAIDPDSPSGYVCLASDTHMPCTGVPNIILQPLMVEH